MKKFGPWICLLFLSLITGSLTIWIAGEYQKATSAETKKRASSSSWSVDRVSLALESLDHDLRLAEEALDRGDISAAAQIWQLADAAFEETYNRHGWISIGPHLTVRDAYQTRQRQFQQVQKRSIDKQLESLGNGEGSFDNLKCLFSEFHPGLSAELRRDYTEALEQAERKQMAAATVFQEETQP